MEPGVSYEDDDETSSSYEQNLVDLSSIDFTEEEDDSIGRARSRSRSIHDYRSEYKSPCNPILQNIGNKEPRREDGTRQLQWREVAALQRGLEEATKSIGITYDSEEEDEDRQAADAEKRHRQSFAASNSMSYSRKGCSSYSTEGRRIKILTLGDSGVGKSSLVMRWTQDSFSKLTNSTVGVNYKSKKVNVKGEQTQVQVWDTAGQQQFHKITTSYYKGAQGIMLVFDITDQSSLDNMEYWIKNIKSHASDSVHVALIGNKCDLLPENMMGGTGKDDERTSSIDSPDTRIGQSSSKNARDMAAKFDIPFFETSAKESTNVHNAFITLVEKIMDSTRARTCIGTGGKKTLVARMERNSIFGSLLKSDFSIKTSSFNSARLSASTPANNSPSEFLPPNSLNSHPLNTTPPKKELGDKCSSIGAATGCSAMGSAMGHSEDSKDKCIVC